MFDQIDPRSPTPLYEQIAADVRVAVAAGELRPGEALPSVRQVASTLRVNPATVAQAYRELERDGFVLSRRGAGTFVQAVSSDRREGEKTTQARAMVRELLTEAARRGILAASILDAFRDETAANSDSANATPSGPRSAVGRP